MRGILKAALVATTILAAPHMAIASDNVPDAAPEADGESDIIVSGIRQAYRGEFTAQETPQTVNIIDSEDLADNNIVRLADALDLNASVTRQNNFGGSWDSFAVRGFAGDENLPSGYLVNGFNGGRGFGGTRDVAGVERIEILKGPSAALFGRGEPGGTVNIVTKQADFSGKKGSVSLQYGSYDRFRADADANVVFGDVLAVRLIGYTEQADSFRDTVSSKRRGFLPQVAVRLSDTTQIRYDMEWTHAEHDFDRGVLAVDGVLGTIPRTRFLGEPGDGPIVTKVLGHQLQFSHDLSDNWSLLIGGSYRETEFGGYSSFAELADSRQRLLLDDRSLSRQRRLTQYDGEHFVVRGELAGEFDVGGLRNRVLIGADYDRFENDQSLLRYRPGSVAGQTTQSGYILDLLNPVYGQFPLPGPTTVVTDRLTVQKSFGVYVQDQIALTDSIDARFGARFDSFELSIENRLNNSVAARKDERISPQFGIVWQASDTLSLYGAYGSGFRSNNAVTPSNSTVDPEISKSYEIGAKLSFFDGALSANIAVFELQKRNVLASDPLNPGFSTAIGKARSRGVEFDITGTLPGDIGLLISYSYIDAEARAAVADPDFAAPIAIGDPLINIPNHSLNAQLSKGFALGDTKLTIGAGYQYIGKRSGQTATDFTLPAYSLARLFARWQVSDGVEVFGTVNNLFDKTYYSNSYHPLWVQPGTPRTGTVGVRLSF